MIPKLIQEVPSVSPRAYCGRCSTKLQDGGTVVMGMTLPRWGYCPICGERIEWEKMVPIKWEPLDCKICGNTMIRIDRNGIPFATSAYNGTEICVDCQMEHCYTTNCLACEMGKYPDCQHKRLKEIAIARGRGNRNE